MEEKTEKTETKEQFQTRMQEMYANVGCKNRREYLQQLADIHGLSIRIIITTANLLGQQEDFDGLPIMLEDIAEEGDDFYE